MQICKDCGSKIKYIAIGVSKIIACDDVLKTIWTENGRKVEGYSQHKCEKKNG